MKPQPPPHVRRLALLTSVSLVVLSLTPATSPACSGLAADPVRSGPFLYPVTHVQPGQALVVQLPSPKPWTLPGAASTSTQFVYDGDGGRVKVTTPSGTTKFLGASYEVAPTGTTTKYIFAETRCQVAIAHC